MEQQQLLTLSRVANEFGVTEITIGRWIKLGRLRVVKMGPTTRRISRAELNRFIERSTNDSPARTSSLNLNGQA